MKISKNETKLTTKKGFPTLDELLAESRKENFELEKEERQFMGSTVGREIIKYE